MDEISPHRVQMTAECIVGTCSAVLEVNSIQLRAIPASSLRGLLLVSSVANSLVKPILSISATVDPVVRFSWALQMH